jgi:hypothetical protein
MITVNRRFDGQMTNDQGLTAAASDRSLVIGHSPLGISLTPAALAARVGYNG